MRIITTNADKEQFWQETEAKREPVGCMNLISLYPQITRQEMRGFGGAFTEAAGYCYSRLDKKVKQEVIRAYFGSEGLCYSMGRTHLNSCDFALSNYAAVENADDVELAGFSLKREEKYLFPLIRDAKAAAGEELILLVSPWSPPAFMKTNGDMNHGGKLKEECRSAWAAYLCRYIRELEESGFSVGYMTVQNEPDAVQTWDSCIYTAQEEMRFVRDYLGPELKRQGLSHVRILVWDHNKESAYERADAVYSDKKAADMIYGTAVHWYTGDHFQNLALIKEKYPGKELFFTEGCVEYSRFADSGEVQKAEMYAHDMLGNFSHGVSAFLDWNLLLDAQGGPNHVGNFCAAPVMCTADFGGVKKRLSYYYIGHFSRYIKKGAKRIEVSPYCQEAETVAFVNPDGERAVILLNRSGKKIDVALGERSTGMNLTLEPHTIITVCYYPEE